MGIRRSRSVSLDSGVMGEMKAPKVLIARGTFSDIYEPTWAKALNDIGVTAEIFDSHAFTLPALLGRIERRLLFGPGICRARRELVKKVRQVRPEIVLLYQGHYYDFETVEELKKYSFVTGFHDDSPFDTRGKLRRYRHLLRALDSYDGYHFYRDIDLQLARSFCRGQVAVLKSFFAPWLHRPMSLSVEERRSLESDIVFVGHAEDDQRINCFTKAIDAGIRTRIFGPSAGWSRFLPMEHRSRIPAIFPIYGDTYVKALRASKIAACFFSKWNRATYTRRSFEIPACRVFLLSERTEDMLTFYEEDREAVYFDSSDEFVDKSKFYLKHDSLRDKIAAAGYAKVNQEGHDVHSRMRQWHRDITRWIALKR